MMIPGIVAQRRYSAPVVSYLDSLSPAPRVAYSLRKVISTATLSIRVRRSNDNAEQDIGFSGNSLDTAALASFVGSNSAFVTVFYDQTATGVNMAQASASAQPRIVNAGAFDGALVFDGSNDAMASSAAISFGDPYASAYMKAAISNQSALGIILESSANYNGSLGSFIWYMENSLHAIGLNGGASYRRDFSAPDSGSLRKLTARYQMAVADGTIAQQRFRAAGADIAPSASTGTQASPPVNFTTQTLYLGARAAASFFMPMQVHTMAIYAADTDASVGAIEAIVGA